MLRRSMTPLVSVLLLQNPLSGWIDHITRHARERGDLCHHRWWHQRPIRRLKDISNVLVTAYLDQSEREQSSSEGACCGLKSDLAQEAICCHIGVSAR